MMPSLHHLSLLLAALVGVLGVAVARQHILLDSSKEQMLDWTKYPHGPKAPTPGWVEESFTNFDKGINWRSYVVCDVTYPDVNNWLWTPFIERGDANRIYIDIKFSIRACDLFPGNAVQCKETFSLLFYEFDAATREPPPWEPESYKLIDRIAADEGRFKNNNEVIINSETRSIEVNKKGVYIAFRDQGACISLLAIKVYYITCPEMVKGFAHFPETPTGKSESSTEKIGGVCVNNADPMDVAPYSYCKSDGTWLSTQGGCQCIAGHQPSGLGESRDCQQCSIGKYKPSKGDVMCEVCPPHSTAVHTGSLYCSCNPGFYRAPSDPTSAACTTLPSAPRNLTVVRLDAHALTLTWMAPARHGGRTDTVYRVECRVQQQHHTTRDGGSLGDIRDDTGCGPGVTFNPPPTPSIGGGGTNSIAGLSGGTIPNTFVSVNGLEARLTYTFRVFSENGVTRVAETTRNNGGVGPNRRLAANMAEIVVNTESLRRQPANGHHHLSSGGGNNGLPTIYVKSVAANSVRVGWRPPQRLLTANDDGIGDLYMDIEMYEVRYFVRGLAHSADNNTTLTTRNDEIEITGLRESTEYGFQVRAKTSRTWGEFTQPIYQVTRPLTEPEAYPLPGDGATGTPAIVGAVVAGLVLLMIVTVMITLYLKRGSEDWQKKQAGDSDTLEFRGVSPHYSVDNGPGIVHTHTGGTMPLFNTFATHKTYIDPHTYEDPHQAVRQFAKELDPRFITIEAIIGGGEFGDVCRGRLLQADCSEMLVAIKTLKPGSSDKARADFLTEASIMGQFEHPNVIFLQGVVTKATPVMIITEYMENGSLDTFLRANDGKFQVMQLVGMMRGIAYGMQYLAEMNYVHRDLAARNVLVNSQLVCKIADFGLSREISESAIDGAYTTRGGKIPVRWTAPEAIAFRKFTSSSDAWSFGIVMWEVMSYGERPYWDWTNQEVIKQIEKGFRLPAPMDCPEALHQLMLDCWQKERAHRPSFANIVKTLDKLICCPETLRKISSNQACNPFAPDAPDLTQFNSVDEWLASIKMSRYSDNFAAAGLVSIEQVARLGLTQLIELGVTLVGHQKKIINSIQAIRTQLSVNVSEGFLV